jgi:hypothetical protein
MIVRSRLVGVLLVLVVAVAGLGMLAVRLWPLFPFTSTERVDPQTVSPVLSVDTDGWNFGIVPAELNSLSHTFQISNNGQQRIELQTESLGCSCLAVECPGAIAPGTEVPVKVDLEIRNRQGHFATHVLLRTTDPDRPTIDLRLQFYAQPKIHFDPPFLQFADVARGDVVEREFQVITRLEPEAEAKPPVIQEMSPAVHCKYLSTEVENVGRQVLRRAAHHYRVRLDTKSFAVDEPRTRLDNVLRFRVAGTPDATSVEMPIEIHFRHHKWLKGQTSITLKAAMGQEARVRLWSSENKPFTIARVVSSLPSISGKALNKASADRQEILVCCVLKEEKSLTTLDKGVLEIYVVEDPDTPYHVDVLLLP